MFFKHSTNDTLTDKFCKKLEKCTLPHRAMIEVKPMRKFKIPNIPATEPKSIRFPVDVISEVEHTIRGKDCTFSAFVVEAVRVALESLREEDEELDVSEKDIEEKWKKRRTQRKGAAFFCPSVRAREKTPRRASLQKEKT